MIKDIVSPFYHIFPLDEMDKTKKLRLQFGKPSKFELIYQ